jgi:NosR/NirI family transcriptional regulator, nitrous oxide reductase regulator
MKTLLVLLCAAMLSAGVHAQAGDEWDFPEEEEVAASWSDDIRNQAVDLAAVSGFLVVAFVSFFRKDERLKIAVLVASVAYLGFYKSQLLSIVNVFGVLGAGLPVFRYALGWYLLAIVGVVSTVLWGRVYCGRLCAFGALTQLLDRLVPARLQVKIPLRIERRASLIKYVILVGAVAYFLITKNPLIYPYIEPFWLFGLHGTPVLWAGLAALLLGSIFVRNLYCRFLCPLGAALGVMSQVTTVFRIKRWRECSTCRICQKACEWGAIEGPRIIRSECVRCDDCERLYDDHTRCPHHLIIIRKADIMARRSVQPVGSTGL